MNNEKEWLDYPNRDIINEVANKIRKETDNGIAASATRKVLETYWEIQAKAE